VESGQLATHGLPDIAHLALSQVRQAERFSVHAFPQRERPIHHSTGVIEGDETRRQNACSSSDGRGDGFCSGVGDCVGMVGRDAERDVARRIDAIRQAH